MMQLSLVLTRVMTVAVWLALLSSCVSAGADKANGGVQPSARGATVTGLVIRASATDQGGTLVTLQSSSGDSEGTTLTDSSGAYRFGDVPNGKHRVLATHSGSQDAVSDEFEVDSQTLEVAPIELAVLVNVVTGHVRMEGRTQHAGATVRVSGTTLEGQTDSEGTFTINDVPPGTHLLTVSAEGYRDATSSPFQGEDETIDVGVVVLHAARGSLAGSVHREGSQDDDTGVLVTLDGTSYAAISGPRGVYSFADIPVGQYSVSASAPGYRDGHASDQSVVIDETTAVPRFVLAANPGTLIGVAQLAGATDHAGTLVTLVGSGLTALTQADGSYAIDEVPAGLYSITATHDTYETENSSTVFVPAGTATSVPPLTLTRSRGRLGGRVLLDGASSHAGVQVEVVGTPHAATTTASGDYLIDGVETGLYEVRATALGYMTSSASSVQVARNETALVGTLTLAANPGRIAGKVLREGTSDHSGTLVTVVGTGLSAVTAVDGSYSIAAVPAGLHSVTATAGGFDTNSSPIISVSPGALSTLSDLGLLRSNGNVSGTVEIEGQATHGGVLVEIVGTPYSTTTTTSGAYTLQDVAVGTYAVTASLQGYVSSTAASVSVAGRLTTQLAKLTLAANPGSIAGKVLREGTLDHSDTLVTVVGTGLSAVTAVDGSYSIAAVPAGLHSVTATAGGFDTISSPIISVAPGALSTLSDLSLLRSRGNVSGTVEIEGQATHGGVLVEIVGTPYSTTTTTSGAYTLQDVPVGSYAVTASLQGYVSGTAASVSVASRLTTQVAKLTLAANPGSIAGKVLREGTSDHSGTLVTVVGTGLSAVTAVDGSYSIAAVPAGLQSVQATASDFDTTSSPIISVAPGALSTLSDLSLLRSKGNVSGTVEIEGQATHGGVLVEIVGTPYSTTTTTSGAYTLQGVPVGTYAVTASMGGFVSATAPTITVTGNATVAVSKLTLAANPGAISGIVLKEGTLDHAGIIVTVNGTSYTGSTQSNGSFLITDVPGGVYSVSASSPGYQRFDFPLVVVTAGQTTDAGSGALDRTKGPVHGVVTLEGRTVHSAVVIQLAGTSYVTTSAADGTFEFSVPIGNYAGAAYSMPQFAPRQTSQTITVTESGVANLSPTQLTAISNDVTGSVTLYGQQNHAGVHVQLLGQLGLSTQGLMFSTTSEADGSFQFAAIPMGPYDVRYSYQAGWGTLARTANVVPADAIQLPPEQLRQTYVYINADAPFTTTRNVTLTLNYSDCYQMRVGNIADVSDGSWQACAGTLPWTLTAGDGAKTVYAQFRDGTLAPSAIVNDTITMKSSATITSINHDGSAPLARGDSVHFVLSTLNDVGGNAKVDIAGYDVGIQLYDDGTHGDVTAADGVYERDYQAFIATDVNGATVTGRFTDKYDNIAPAVQAASQITVAIPPLLSNIQVVPNLTTGTATISWTTDEPADALLQWGTTQFYGSSVANSQRLASHSFSIGSGTLAPSTQYHFRITSTDAAGNTTVSTDRTFYMKPNPPGVVIALPGDARCDVRWEAPPQDNIVGYNVYRATSSGGPRTKLNSSSPYTHPALFYSDHAVTNGTSYFYVVTAVDSLGWESELSSEATGAPLPAAGPTYVQGALTGVTRWTSTGSPYIVSGSVLVQSGALLVVGPGVDVRFDGNYFLRVDGEIVALGDPSAPVLFSSNKPAPRTGDWASIQLRSGTFGRHDLTKERYLSGNIFYRATIEYAGDTCLTATNRALTVISSAFRNCSYNGWNQSGYYANPTRGAGLSSIEGSLLLTDSVVQSSACSGGACAGGIFAGFFSSAPNDGASGGNVRIVRTLVDSNSTAFTAAGHGAGGILLDGVSGEILNSVISGNTTGQCQDVTCAAGLAIDHGGTVLVRGTTVLRNVETPYDSQGTYYRCGLAGGIGTQSKAGFPGVLTVVDSFISENRGCYVGGVSGAQLIANSTLSHNTGSLFAGGALSGRAVATTFEDNLLGLRYGNASMRALSAMSTAMISCLITDSSSSVEPVIGSWYATWHWNHFRTTGSGGPVAATVDGDDLQYNSFLSNTRPHLLRSAGADTAPPLKATATYWGAPVTSEMNSLGADANITSIYDFYDDITVSKVDYSNWAQTAFPLARITSPSWGVTYTTGQAISLQGHADDPEDGVIPSASLSWESETDGPLGTGSTLNISTLTPGLQRIWLNATDSAGQVGKVYVELQVEAP